MANSMIMQKSRDATKDVKLIHRMSPNDIVCAVQQGWRELVSEAERLKLYKASPTLNDDRVNELLGKMEVQHIQRLLEGFELDADVSAVLSTLSKQGFFSKVSIKHGQGL